MRERSLPLRIFPDRIMRRRQAPGYRDRFGEFQPGSVTEKSLACSIQPDAATGVLTPEGERREEELVIYFPLNPAAAARSAVGDGVDPAPRSAAGLAEADEFDWDGRRWSVESVRTWSRSHARARAVLAFGGEVI